MASVHFIGRTPPPITGIVETFSEGLVETCFNYPFATLYAKTHFGIDRSNK